MPPKKLLLFKKPGCLPCEVMERELSIVLNETTPSLELTTVDLSEHPEVGERMDIQSTPALLFVNDGKLVDVIHGVVNREYLRKSLQNFINL
ncbi:MAG: thioredoxin family protein [Bacteroidetes bacterium]|nr:thioredoxin family protein [Bacteroidota bacterium]